MTKGRKAEVRCNREPESNNRESGLNRQRTQLTGTTNRHEILGFRFQISSSNTNTWRSFSS